MWPKIGDYDNIWFVYIILQVFFKWNLECGRKGCAIVHNQNKWIIRDVWVIVEYDIGYRICPIICRNSEEFGDRDKCVLSDMREYSECEWWVDPWKECTSKFQLIH